ncbi:MAG: DUF1788 domain-containing protein [Liquorilactobacillus ghanensis]|uniref:DUF1788 domain-containing protein n=1 Tax=Liquorilactobacillus ghanensis TaxID=399370 RepID=UPI0039E7A606
MNLALEFKNLEKKMLTEKFQNNEGLSNEVGYYIFAYNPKDELTVRDYINDLQKKFTFEKVGFNLKVINIYEVILKIIDSFNYRDNFMQMEKEEGITEVAEQINNILEMNEDENLIVREVEDQLNNQKAEIFITGIGQVFPLLRAHKILNTMHQIIDQYPVVMFYPGKFDGLSLRMFNEINDHNYYRAFPLNKNWGNPNAD